MPVQRKVTAKTHDEYLASLFSAQRSALEKLRQAIRSAAPHAEECISYQLAAFRLGGRMLVAYGATPNHCAFYLMSTTVMGDFDGALDKYDTGGGTIRFPEDRPLPAALVRKLVKARMAENTTQSGKVAPPTKAGKDGNKSKKGTRARRPQPPTTRR